MPKSGDTSVRLIQGEVRQSAAVSGTGVKPLQLSVHIVCGNLKQHPPPSFVFLATIITQDKGKFKLGKAQGTKVLKWYVRDMNESELALLKQQAFYLEFEI